jgi:hypothetical protein
MIMALGSLAAAGVVSMLVVKTGTDSEPTRAANTAADATSARA